MKLLIIALMTIMATTTFAFPAPKALSDAVKVNHSPVGEIESDSLGNAWFIESAGATCAVVKCDNAGTTIGKYGAFSIVALPWNHLAVDVLDNVWTTVPPAIGTWGITKFDNNGNWQFFVRIQDDAFMPDFIVSDVNNNVWVVPANNGVIIQYDNNGVLLRRLTGEVISSHTIGVAYARGKVWVATLDGGGYCIDTVANIALPATIPYLEGYDTVTKTRYDKGFPRSSNLLNTQPNGDVYFNDGKRNVKLN